MFLREEIKIGFAHQILRGGRPKLSGLGIARGDEAGLDVFEINMVGRIFQQRPQQIPFVSQFGLRLLALRDVTERPDPSMIPSILAQHGRRDPLQNRSILELNFILAAFVRMSIEIRHLFPELFRPGGCVHDVPDLGLVVIVGGNGCRNPPQIHGPLVLQNLLALRINHQDAIGRGIKCGVEQRE